MRMRVKRTRMGGVRGRACGVALGTALSLGAAIALTQPGRAQAPAASNAGGVSAGQTPPAPGDSNIRGFTLRNLSGKTITAAHAHLTNDATDLIASQTPLRSQQARPFGARGKACLDSVSVTFRDGQTLNADHLNDCEAQTVVVRADKITLASSARPGNTASPGPSNRMDSSVAAPSSATPGLPKVGP